MVARFLVIGAVAALVAVGAARQLEALGRARPAPAAGAPAAMQSTASTSAADEDAAATIAKGADGHFWADAEVDGHPVHVLVDTGATTVALTLADARSLGLNPDSLTYSYTVMTANGSEKAAPVQLNVVSVGRAEVSNVQAFVLQGGLETSLLGMSYLGRLSKFEATPDSLILRS